MLVTIKKLSLHLNSLLFFHELPLHHRHRPFPLPQRPPHRLAGQGDDCHHADVGLGATIPIINILDGETVWQALLVDFLGCRSRGALL